MMEVIIGVAATTRKTQYAATMCCCWVIVSMVLAVPPTLGTTNLEFEAAFQGSCIEKNPCEQTCFDLHDGTFECGCHRGYILSADGYSCKVDRGESFEDYPPLMRGGRMESIIVDGRKTSPLKVMSHVVKSNDDEEVDKEERPISEFHRSVPKIPMMTATAAAATVTTTVATNFDDNEMIKYTEEDDEEKGDLDDFENNNDDDEEEEEEDEDDEIMEDEENDDVEGRRGGFEGFDVQQYATYDDIMMEAKKSFEVVEDEEDSVDESESNVVTMQSSSTLWLDNNNNNNNNRQTEDGLEVLCERFQCEGNGVCVSDTGHQSGVQCLCPLGRGGQHCEKYFEVRFPKFHGLSHLVLPPLKNAYKDLQMTLEFRPETKQGLVLFSGEHWDASGDYLLLVIVDGHLEFRFDCGSGASVIRSRDPVLLHKWNKVIVFRHRWDAWIQLNGGEHIQGRSRGLFSRLTFKEKLYIGGAVNLSAIPLSRVGSHQGFDGCIRYLEINGHNYDFRPTPKGDAIAGLGLDECSSEVCNNVDCKNGGKCIANSADSALCLCPLGFAGDYCETVVDLIMPYFNGTSYLKYPGLGSSVLSFVEIWITFKPVEADGVFFYNGHKSDGSGDFMSLSLSGCFVEFRFDLGTGPAILRSPDPVSLHEWHTVFISRTGRDGILEVNSQPRVEGMASGAFTQLSLPQNLYIGGVPSFDLVSRELGVHTSFRGCIQKIHINDKPLKLFEAALVGVNVDNCNHPCVNRPCMNHGLCSPRKEYFSCHCLLGYADARCQTEIKDNIVSPMFMGNSFLRYTRQEILKRIIGNGFDIRLRFRTLSSDGLLLWTGRREMTATSDFVAIALQSGHVHLRYNLGSGEIVIQNNHTRVDDGGWHTLRAVRTNKEGSLGVDDTPVVTKESPGYLTQVNTDTGLYLGGIPNTLQLTLGKYTSGFMGCVSEFRLDNDHAVHLVSHAQGGLNVEACV